MINIGITAENDNIYFIPPKGINLFISSGEPFIIEKMLNFHAAKLLKITILQ